MTKAAFLAIVVFIVLVINFGMSALVVLSLWGDPGSTVGFSLLCLNLAALGSLFLIGRLSGKQKGIKK